MKKLLRYIIPILFAIFALVGNQWESDSKIIENRTETLSLDTDNHYLESPSSYFDLNLPRHILCVNNVVRTQNTTKRTRNGHRNNFEFEKTGKTLSVKIDNLVQKNSFNHYHHYVNSVSLLISFGKFII